MKLTRAMGLIGDVSSPGLTPQFSRSYLQWVIRRYESLHKEKCEKSYRHFVEQAWPNVNQADPFVPGWHIDAMCEHLDAVARGYILRLLISAPPRHSKSYLVSVLWQPWVWTWWPAAQWMCSSYSFDLAKRDASRARWLVESGWYRALWGKQVNLRDDQNEKRRYDTTKGGFRFTTSVGGVTTGEGANFRLIDDPFNVMDVESKTVREEVAEWFATAWASRVGDPKKARSVIAAQRTHERDLSGIVLDMAEENRYVHLCLPAEYDPKRSCVTIYRPLEVGRSHAKREFSDPRTEPGEPLWPDRWGKPELARAKAEMGEIAYEAQMQQNPLPRGGVAFRAHWIRYYSIEGDDVVMRHPDLGDVRFPVAEIGEDPIALPPAEKDGNGKHEETSTQSRPFTILAADTAETTKTSSDYTAVGLFASRGPDLFVRDFARERLQGPDAIRLIRVMHAKHHPRVTAIGARPPSVIQSLRRPAEGGAPALSIREMPESSETNKFERSLAARILAEAGNLWLPDSVRGSRPPWVGALVAELIAFSPAMTHEHDDQVDALSHAATVHSEEYRMRQRRPVLSPGASGGEAAAAFERRVRSKAERFSKL